MSSMSELRQTRIDALKLEGRIQSKKEEREAEDRRLRAQEQFMRNRARGPSGPGLG